jgi:hypothetical protein
LAAIATPEYVLNPKDGIPMILEGTLLALGADGGGNWSLVQPGTADNQAAVCTGVLVYTGPAPIGFINEHSDTLAVAGEQVTVFMGGVVWAIAGAAITKGRPVMSQAAVQSGRVVTCTDGNWGIGIAMAAAAAEDDAIPIWIQLIAYEAT